MTNRTDLKLNFEAEDGKEHTERKPAVYTTVREDASTGATDRFPSKSQLRTGSKYDIEESFDPQSRFDNLERFEKEFWKKKPLEELTKDEWEILCDGCGKCCLNKIEIKGKIKFTNACCRFLDCKTCLCQIYEHRFKKVYDCRDIDLSAVREQPRWLPKTCTYWLLDNGFDLPQWHPLISGLAKAVHDAKMSLKDRDIISESEVTNYENHTIDWQDL